MTEARGVVRPCRVLRVIGDFGSAAGASVWGVKVAKVEIACILLWRGETHLDFRGSGAKKTRGDFAGEQCGSPQTGGQKFVDAR